MCARCRRRRGLCLADRVQQRGGNEAHLMHETRAVGGNRLYRNAADKVSRTPKLLSIRGAPVQDVEKVARDGLALVSKVVLVDASLKGCNEFVAVLFNYEADQLLGKVRVRTTAATWGGQHSLA